MNRHDAFLEEFLEIFSSGIEVDDDAREFASSMTGRYPDQAFFREALEAESADSEAILDLVFSPGHLARQRIEDLIPEDFGPSDEEKLIRELVSSGPSCLMRYAGDEASFSFKVPERMVERFVKRFNLSNKVPEGLRRTVRTTFPDSAQSVLASVRAKAVREDTFALIMDFMENLSGVFRPLPGDVDMIMTISGMFPGETKIASALALANRKWDFALKKHEDHQSLLASGCVEELMAKGVRIQSINREDIEEKLAGAERIFSLLRYSPESILYWE